MRKLVLAAVLAAGSVPGAASAAIIINYGGDVTYDHVPGGASTLSLLGSAVADDFLIGLGNTLELSAVFLGAEERGSEAVGVFGSAGGRDWTITSSGGTEVLFGSVASLDFAGTIGATGEPFEPFPGAGFEIDPPIAEIRADLLISGGTLLDSVAPDGLLLTTVFDVSCDGITACGFTGAWGVDAFDGDFVGVPINGTVESGGDDVGVPEAGTWALAGAGLLGLFGIRRRAAVR